MTTETKRTTEWTSNAGKQIEEQRFEFILYINDHIICQRYFNIRDYNDDAIKSVEMKQLMENICGMNNGNWGELGIIPKFLKNKAVDYIWNNYNPYNILPDQGTKNIYEKIDNFQFEIRVDKKMVAKSQFTGNVFPPKVRYAVDIKEIIPSIMGEIRQFLSQKKYTKA